LEPIPESALGQSNSSRLVCHACSQVPGGTYACSNDRFLVHHFVRVENVPVPAVDHPWRATVGTAGGALNPAFGPSINVDYSLDDRYRAFLLQGYDHGSTHVDLSTAAGGDTFLALPLHSSLPRRVERLTTDYQHARIYDSGDCSLTLGWTDLTNLFAVGVNTEVGNAAASEPLVHWVRSDSFTLAPTLDSEPTYPASFPLGPLTEHDQIHIQADFTAGTGTILGIGCSHDTAHVHVALDARVVLHDGFFETPESTEQLALLRQVGCVVDPESDKHLSMHVAQAGHGRGRDDYGHAVPRDLRAPRLRCTRCQLPRLSTGPDRSSHGSGLLSGPAWDLHLQPSQHARGPEQPRGRDPLAA